MADDGLYATPDARAVVHILVVPMDPERLAVLTAGLKARGLIPWVDNSFVPSGPISTSPEAFLNRIEISREAIADKHPEMPVALLGLDYGAMIAAALVRRLPGQYRAVCLCNMPDLSLAKRALLLALLYWERFRLGSDVPSQILRKSGQAPTIIGLAIAALRLARHSKAFSDCNSVACPPVRNLSASDLNQNLSEAVGDWIQSELTISKR